MSFLISTNGNLIEVHCDCGWGVVSENREYIHSRVSSHCITHNKES